MLGKAVKSLLKCIHSSIPVQHGKALVPLQKALVRPEVLGGHFSLSLKEVDSNWPLQKSTAAVTERTEDLPDNCTLGALGFKPQQ